MVLLGSEELEYLGERECGTGRSERELSIAIVRCSQEYYSTTIVSRDEIERDIVLLTIHIYIYYIYSK